MRFTQEVIEQYTARARDMLECVIFGMELAGADENLSNWVQWHVQQEVNDLAEWSDLATLNPMYAVRRNVVRMYEWVCAEIAADPRIKGLLFDTEGQARNPIEIEALVRKIDR